MQEQDKQFDQSKEEYKRPHKGGTVLAGLILLGVGGILLARQFGYIFPYWLFTWPMILVVVGLFIGARHNFRDFGWIVVTGIGVVFLLDDLWPNIPIRHFIWPIAIIAVGLFIIIAPRRTKDWATWRHNHRWRDQIKTTAETFSSAGTGKSSAKYGTGDEWLDIVSIFSGTKKIVFTKDFKGGEIVCVFGGAEIDLTQADISGPVTLDMVQIFGGAKLVVPSHWLVRSETATIFGGVDDKRRGQTNTDPNKVLILKGTTLFGGIEIKSY